MKKRAYPEMPADVKKWVQNQIATYREYVADLTAEDPSFEGLSGDYEYFLEGVLEGQIESGNLPPRRDAKVMEWLLEKHADEVRAMFEASQSTDEVLQQFKTALEQENYEEARSLYEQLNAKQRSVADEMAKSTFAKRNPRFKKFATNMFDFIRALMDEGHVDQARELLAIERERKKMAMWPFKKKEPEAPKPDVWDKIKELPHEKQIEVLDKAKESHWGQRMEQHPSEEDLWNALHHITNAKREEHEIKEGG